MEIFKKKESSEQIPTQEIKPEQVEAPIIPEVAIEIREQQDTEGDQSQNAIADQQAVLNASIGQTKTVSVPIKDELAEKIEDVLEEDLTDTFLSMSPDVQIKFKQKGEETVSKIRLLMTKTKLHTKKIFHLVRSWMSLIPGVNRFFLEQEAKIKTDKIKQLNDQAD